MECLLCRKHDVRYRVPTGGRGGKCVRKEISAARPLAESGRDKVCEQRRTDAGGKGDSAAPWERFLSFRPSHPGSVGPAVMDNLYQLCPTGLPAAMEVVSICDVHRGTPNHMWLQRV